MSTFKLQFDTGNAAFTDGDGPDEAARILRLIADRAESRDGGGAIYDVNGNRIGTWSAEYPEVEE